MNRAATLLLTSLLMAALFMMSGCSSGPSEEELKQLSDLKAEYASLQKEVATLSQEKEALEKQVAEKNAQLKKCYADQETVRQRLGK
jgi:septal ring factor EnvC (AmiA/AmiB activator)